MQIKSYRTWIEISAGNLKANIATFRRLIGRRVKFLAVIKSNAYGHGLMTIARACASLGADFLGVDSIAEANKLRREKIKLPILVLGYTQVGNLPIAAKKNIALMVSTFETLEDIRKLKKNIKVHIKVDTGMHRQGFFVSDLPKVLDRLQKAPWIKVEGLFTHLASAKKPDSHRETEKQLRQFSTAIEIFKSAYPKILVHAAATAGALNYPLSHYDMVRTGIGLYGLWPSPETKTTLEKSFSLKPVLTWKTIVSEQKTREKGQKVGYDYTEKLKRRSRLAVLPIGYWHGYFRAFSSKAFVLISGRRCKVVGRVSMDMIVADVTGVKRVRVGDEAVLIGRQGKEEITADELAKIAGTSNYEIVTRLNPLIKKYYV